MRKLALFLAVIALGLTVVETSPAQEIGPPTLFRLGLFDEDIFLEQDANVPTRYTLFWGGWITVDSRTRDPIKIVGECSLTPLGMWTMAPTNRFGTSRLVPGINTFYQKFALASIDLPRDAESESGNPSLGSLFDYTQGVKLQLSIMRRDFWVGAPALAQQRYELKPLGYALLKAASTGDARIVRELLDKGADADSATVLNWTALMEAASQGHRDVVKLLLDQGAKVNARTRGFPFVVTELGARFPSGHTALMAA
ncbi:MAG: ankyrin repeat domain-containing protein, partial [Deltaproteobacteria bacterium]|nr:ankyrin repeat domain-containing protein [Deltaproteobacteria bacterium]